MLNLSKGSNLAKEASGVTGNNPETACSIAKDAVMNNSPRDPKAFIMTKAM